MSSEQQSDIASINIDWMKPQLSEMIDRMKNIHRWLDQATPWITTGAREWLDTNILPTDACLEYGGGKSTIWWAKKAAHVTCVEASPEWTLALLTYLIDRPELLKKFRMYTAPAEWNPDFAALKKYWIDNKASITSADAAALERDLIGPEFPGHNVAVFDGSIRDKLFARRSASISNYDIVVIDNTEDLHHSMAPRYCLGDNFKRLDFIERNESAIPKWQNGKHITTIFVSKLRLAVAQDADAGQPRTLTSDEVFDYLGTPNDQRAEMIRSIAAEIRRYQSNT